MNIYEKLQKSRVDLQKKDCKKTGKNTYSNYEYFQLADFLPEINEILASNKLCSMVTFEIDGAKLTIIDSEKPDDKLVFTSPAATVSLKGAHDIQNLGAMQTYQRRYLYLAAFEIVEDDSVDSLPKNTQEPHKKNDPPKDAKKTEFIAMLHSATEKGLSNNDVKSIMIFKFKVDSSDKLSIGQVKTLHANLEKYWQEYLDTQNAGD